ncbi:hypothetical protein M758_UG049000 [Ceratodon purpureus]|nr:hypothetical protein M758_UG049000 [Ceratodon purpureus]
MPGRLGLLLLHFVARILVHHQVLPAWYGASGIRLRLVQIDWLGTVLEVCEDLQGACFGHGGVELEIEFVEEV